MGMGTGVFAHSNSLLSTHWLLGSALDLGFMLL